MDPCAAHSARARARRLAGLLVALPAALAVVAVPAAARAQAPARDTLRLGDLHAAATARDPRDRQRAIRQAESALRLRTIDGERAPVLSASGQAQYQSVVTEIPGARPGGAVPTPPHDTYDASLRADVALLDPSRAPRRALERARLATAEAGVEATRVVVRQQVNAAFFQSALLDAQARMVEASLTDLEAQRALAAARVGAGTGLRGDEVALRAELLRRAQDLDRLRADRMAALAVLAELTGRDVDTTAVLALPDLGAAVAAARRDADSLRARPEFAQFARRRELLARQADVAGSSGRPRLGAFARGGVGRPGLNVLQDQLDPYWLGGVQVQWTLWNAGRTTREREVLALEADAVATEEAAFREALRRGTIGDLAAIDRLGRALATDDTIIGLRAQVLREAAERFREQALSAAEYVDRQTDLLVARLTRASHQVELARARADYLTTLGLEVRP